MGKIVKNDEFFSFGQATSLGREKTLNLDSLYIT